ncbi:MAG: hypothetical protein GC162_12575 [Planctomycetes bacterium]|nr:hypothetical protein [Planctomycetota bacterium]
MLSATRKMMSLVIAAAVFSGASSARAAQMLIFDMNDITTTTTSVTAENVVGTPTLTLAGGSLVSGGATGTSYLDTAAVNHSAGKAAGWSSGVNDAPTNEFTLVYSSIGWSDYTIRFDYRSTSTGSPTLTLEYKVGAGSFTNLDTITLTQDSTFHAYSKDLSAISAIENVFPNITIHGVWTAGTSGGTSQIDNLELFGTAVTPIPTPAALPAGLVLMSGFMMRRKNRA